MLVIAVVILQEEISVRCYFLSIYSNNYLWLQKWWWAFNIPRRRGTAKLKCLLQPRAAQCWEGSFPTDLFLFFGVPPLSGTHFLVQFLMCRKVAKIRDCTKHLCLAFLVFSLFYLSCSPQVLWTPVMKHLESEYSCCLPNVEMLNPYLCWSSSSVCDGRAF